MSEHITHTPSIKRLERSANDKWLAGVCGGLGRYFDLNPAVFRLGLVVLTLLGGAGILIYLAALLVLPAEGGQSIAAEVLAGRREHPWQLVGLGLAVAAIAALLSRASSWPSIGAGWIVILIAGLAVLWVSRKERRGRRIAVALTALLATLGVLAGGSHHRCLLVVRRQPWRRHRRPGLFAARPPRQFSRCTSSASGTCESTCRTSRPTSRSTSGRGSGSAS